MSETLVAAVAAVEAPARIWVGYSGGLDSSALLAAAVEAFPGRVRALHVHHGLSANADAWAEHCLAGAARWQLPCEVVRVRVVETGAGLEAAARAARYQVYEARLDEGDVLLTGHHAGDQAETLGLRLGRGAGLEGLAGIAPRRPLGQGWVVRPWLEFPRAELERFARERGLRWIEDESNQELRFARNYWRQRVVPVIEQLTPGFTRQSARAARHLRQAAALLAEYAQADLAALTPRRERLGESIALAPLLALSPARRRAVLRHWLAEHLRLRVSEVRLDLLAAGHYGAEFDWRAGDWHLRVFQQRLYALPRQVLAAPPPAHQPWRPDTHSPLTLPDGSLLQAAPARQGLRADLEYNVGARRLGQRSHPAGRRHSQTLKKLLQEAGLPPWLRARAPLVFYGEELAAVADLWVEAKYFTETGPALALGWQFPCSPAGAQD